MNKIAKFITAFDMYNQSKQFNVSSDMDTYRTKTGAFCSIIVYVLSIVYLFIRFDALINHTDSNVSQMTLPNDVSETEVFTRRVGDTDGKDFRLAVALVEFGFTPRASESLREVGTFSVL